MKIYLSQTSKNRLHTVNKLGWSLSFLCIALALAPAQAASELIASQALVKEIDDETKDKIAALAKELGSNILAVAQNDQGQSFTAVNLNEKFTDAELAKFAPIASVMAELNISRTKVTDEGLVTVAQMKNLQRLRLENTAITDAGLEHIKNCENLEYLNLFNTKITDAGLEKLAGLKKLKRLYVWQTQVTKAGAEKLLASNPSLLINLGWETEVGGSQIVPVLNTNGASTEKVVADNSDTTFYDARIHPLMERTCVSCHGDEKKKGGFQAHNFEAIVKGGKNDGPGIVPGKPEESSIIKRILLPLSDEEHMPPEDKPQLTEKEVGLLKWWISQGADNKKKVTEVTVPAEFN